MRGLQENTIPVLNEKNNLSPAVGISIRVRASGTTNLVRPRGYCLENLALRFSGRIRNFGEKVEKQKHCGTLSVKIIENGLNGTKIGFFYASGKNSPQLIMQLFYAAGKGSFSYR